MTLRREPVQAGTRYDRAQLRQPPASLAPAADARTYVGTYANSYFGPLTVAADGNKLVMRLGRRTFELKHHDGNTFSFPYYASTVAAVTFSPGQGAPGQGGKAASAKIAALDSADFGTFVRG